jgi:hypothetical protein
VAFLTKQTLSIPKLEIEIERVFSLLGILVALKQCRLQVENLNMIIKIVKNWLDDLCMNCMQNKNTKDYLKVEGSLINDNYELIEESKYLKI